MVRTGVLGAFADSADHVSHAMSHERGFDARHFRNLAKQVHKYGERNA